MALLSFQAFKFPDVMDLIIECSVDLCKTDCEMCPNPNQVIISSFLNQEWHVRQSLRLEPASATLGALSMKSFETG